MHQRLLIADLHADTLLWNRDLLKRSDYGHVDLPRLVEGNVAIQAFTVVTKSPRNFNIDPTGRLLLVANVGSNNLVGFFIDQETGQLTPTGHSVTTPNPVCVVFRDDDA